MIKSNDEINWKSAIAKLEGAYSPHTLRGYRSDFVIFETWCRKTKRTPLPATPETVAEFITAQTAACSPSTLKHRIASIRKIHRLMRLVSPTEDEDVAIALRRAFRQKRRRPKAGPRHHIGAAGEAPEGLRRRFEGREGPSHAQGRL